MGFLDTIKGKFGTGKLKAEQLQQLQQIVSRAIADGIINEQEMQTINDFFINSHLTAEEFQNLKSKAYLHIVESVIADRRVTHNELNILNKISEQFEISPAVENQAAQKVKYFHLFAQLEAGEPLPVGNPANIILKKDEIGHLCLPGVLMEERVVSRQFSGSSHGVSIPIVKGIRYSVGKQRGSSYSVRDSVPISDGHFVVTSKRLVFTGNNKSITSDIAQLLDLQTFSDALQFNVTNRQKPTTIKFEVPEEVELCALVISRIINEQ